MYDFVYIKPAVTCYFCAIFEMGSTWEDTLFKQKIKLHNSHINMELIFVCSYKNYIQIWRAIFKMIRRYVTKYLPQSTNNS